MAEPIVGWEPVRLSEIVERRTERNVVGNTRVLTISSAQGLVDQADYFNRVVASKDLSPYFLLQHGDFAYNKSYSVGYPVGVIRRLERYDAGVVSPLYICFRPRAGVVHSDFLEQLLRAGRLDDGIAWIAKEGARNHGLLNVGSADFFALDLNLPPLEQQRRIAEILDTIDEAIRANERVISKLELLLDGVSQAAPLGEPDGGDEHAQALGAFSTSRSGSTPSRSVGRYYGGGIPWVKSGEVAGTTILATDETVSLSAVRDYGLRMARPGTPLVAMYGATAGKVGWLGVEAVTNQAVLAIESDAGRVDPRWLYWALRTGTRRLLNSIQGSGQPNLNKGIIERMAFVLPDLSDQQVTAERLDSAVAVIEAHGRELDKLRRMRVGLAADLLSGRVRTVAA